MRNLSSLGIGLSLVSGFLFLALIAELYYLFWWKKNRANRGMEDGCYRSCSADDLFLPLFCWRKPSSMSSAAINPQEISNPLKPIEEDDDTIEAELTRLQGLPRFLFTIKEETREELESEDGRSRKGSRGRSLSDLFVASSTPFLTPLASPPFFAPPLTLFESSSDEEEFIKMWSSPPPKFKFLRDAEEKSQRKKLMEDAQIVAKEDDADGAFFSVKIGKSRDRGQHPQLSSSQVIPLTSLPSSFRPVH